ncbi:hypothetical protein JXJ21_20220 [candidate division KSB1 bacterium]|nr:hypothetical protein [candidate division KSB1 bacterium]
MKQKRFTDIFVSKLGNNSDGSSWQNAFTTIQAALSAVPDAEGGHRIIVRPDTYFEANLYPQFKGSKTAYNLLMGDFDGAFGSGTSGHVIIDSGDPGQQGFKSYDWWGPIRAYAQGWSKEHLDATFSACIWDRWELRHLYVTGGDGGLFWDGTNRVEPFTIRVENCVSIGRAFGGGVASVLSRNDEPIVFKNCVLWALDWWGDTAGAYVRVENDTMPAIPDVYFEDCVMVSPQCAMKAGNFGFTTFSRIRLTRCRLVTLNFSQPHGTPTDGIIQSVEHGKYMHIELEDCTLMGYKVFGVRVAQETVNEIGYTTKGCVQAYIQFQQALPVGFHRLAHWHVETFQSILPPAPETKKFTYKEKQLIRRDMCEVTPIEWQGKLCLLECHRPARGGTSKDYFITLTDVAAENELARFAEGYSLASGLVYDGVLYVYASRFEENNWNDVTLFKSSDLVHWQQRCVIQQEQEHLFNSSVCAVKDGFVLAYETNDPTYPAFTIKFAFSEDLETWHKIPGALFGRDRYTACPCIRHVDGYTYMLYMEHRKPRHFFETYIARSKDLINWELSSANPVLSATDLDEGINASDPDIIEWQGKTYLYYAVGDQLTWMNIKRNIYGTSLREFFGKWFEISGIPCR